MHKKSLNGVEIKNADLGEVSAVFATFGVTDKDGDITDPKAFTEGAQVAISAYGHKSWEGQLPVGVGTIRTDGEKAIMDGRFFLDTTAGRDTFNALKGMSEAGIPSEWSYGFDVLDSEPAQKDGAKRLLKSMKVYEVSPVLLGAGVDTRTLAIKSQDVSDSLGGDVPSLADELDAAIAALEAKAESAERVVALRSEAGKSISQANAERFARIGEIAERFKALIPAPAAEEIEEEETPDITADYLRFIQITSGE
jgi:hypothetical protein